MRALRQRKRREFGGRLAKLRDAKRSRFHAIDDLSHFANGYMHWTMILDEKATSRWGCRQNSLIILDGAAQKIVDHPEF